MDRPGDVVIRSILKWTSPGAVIAAAILCSAEASGADPSPDGIAPPGNGSAARPDPSPTLQQRAVDMRRKTFESTVREGQSIIARAAAGECHALAARRVDRYREVLDSANALAARAEAALPANPGRAATLYVQADKIARGVVSSGAAVDCTATP